MKKISKSIAILFIIFCKLTGYGQKIDSLLKVLKNQKSDTNKVITYRILAKEFNNVEPKKGSEYAQKGIALGREINFPKGTAGCYINLSVANLRMGNFDLALTNLDSANYFADLVGDPNRNALIYLNKADIYMQKRDLAKSLDACTVGLKYAKKAENATYQGHFLNALGNIYLLQKKYKESLQYYLKSAELGEKNNSYVNMVINYLNIGNAYKYLGKHDLSIKSFKRSIFLADSLDETVNLWLCYGNLSAAYLENGKNILAKENALQAIKYSKNTDNETHRSTAYNFLANACAALGENDNAIENAKIALEISTKAKNIEQQQFASKTLAEMHEKKGLFKEAYYFLDKSKILADSLSKTQFNAEIALLETNLKFEEKDNAIKLLSKDSELNQQKIQQQRAYIFGAFAIALLALAGIWLAINRYKLRQRLKELEIRNQIAADLHDEVGSSLSSIQMLSQMVNSQPHTDEKERAILQKMSNNAKETMEKMSDIVWMIKPGENDATGLGERIQRFLYEIGESKSIECSFTSKNIESLELSMADRKNIYLIFKEAVNNSVKYSGTNKIEASLEYIEKQLILTIKDFGKGFDNEHIKRGNGLENMKNRAKELGGKLEVKSVEGKGTEVELRCGV
jgi:two-component system, NarL family, sensor histidine kinase UhpB